MPLSRPVTGPDTNPPPPFTIDRADVTGMPADAAHDAILGAFDAGVLAARAAAGMADPAIIDQRVAELSEGRTVCLAHGPYKPIGEASWRCFAEGTDGPVWPCPAYRDAAAGIADGLL